MATHLYFVRHGQSNSNADGVQRGEESVLTEKGKEEALVVAERIERIGVDALVASSYARAIETATPISERLGLAIETSDLLVEMRRPSSILGKNADDPEVIAINTELFGNFGVAGYQHSDEETFAEYKERSLEAMRFLKAHPAERICVVTHGIFLRALFCAMHIGEEYTGADFRRMWRMRTVNTGITYAKWEEGRGDWDRGWHIVSWNDMAHLG